jgi:hypothetical protein
MVEISNLMSSKLCYHLGRSWGIVREDRMMLNGHGIVCMPWFREGRSS